MKYAIARKSRVLPLARNLIPQCPSDVETLIDDCVLHTGVSLEAVSAIFTQLLLDEGFASFASGATEEKLDELRGDLDETEKTVREAHRKLKETLYGSSEPNVKLKKSLSAADKEALAEVCNSLFL